MRLKHRKDGNHGKHGWVGGNPRHGRHHGNFRGDAQKLKRELSARLRGFWDDCKANAEDRS